MLFIILCVFHLLSMEIFPRILLWCKINKYINAYCLKMNITLNSEVNRIEKLFTVYSFIIFLKAIEIFINSSARGTMENYILNL